jgi:rubrerythrin
MSDALSSMAAAGRGPDKLLAIGAYGESVAAYRYLVLAEKAVREEERREFAAMADEEQGHKQRLEKLLAELYPNSDFVLTADDKELVVTGPRLLDIRDEAAMTDAMSMILETERKTAAFYGQQAKSMPDASLRDLFQELAEEGVDHYKRLATIFRQSGQSD